MPEMISNYVPVPADYDPDAGFQQALASATNTPISELTFWSLDWLGDHAPEIAQAKWQECVACAMSEIESGTTMADNIVTWTDSVMDKAQFVALRRLMVLDWQPRGAIELTLIDQLATAQYEFMSWTKELRTRRASEEASSKIDLEQIQHHLTEREKRHCGWTAPRLSESEAIKEAMEMVERWNRMSLRIIRQMRDLRRYAPPLVVNNGGQINIAEKQVNIVG